LGQSPTQNTQLQIAATKPSVICCHLANKNEELGGFATGYHPLPLVFSNVKPKVTSFTADEATMTTKDRLLRKTLYRRVFVKKNRRPVLSHFLFLGNFRG